MSIVAVAVAYIFMWLLMSNLSPRTMRRLAGHRLWLDLIVHGFIIFTFIGNGLVLLEGEAAAILFTLSMMAYKRFFGYERWNWQRLRFVRYAGWVTAKV